MKTLNVLSQALRNGLTNSEMELLPNGSEVSFKSYIGDLSATGSYSIDDKVPSGLFIFGFCNFISIPDAIFTNYADGSKIAFYKL